jgi:hypothetical protein
MTSGSEPAAFRFEATTLPRAPVPKFIFIRQHPRAPSLELVSSNSDKELKLRVILWLLRKSLGGRIQQEGRKITDTGWDSAEQILRHTSSMDFMDKIVRCYVCMYVRI